MSEQQSDNILFFDSHNSMREIVFSNPAVLPALSRFRIPLGFGENMVADVCLDHKVNPDTFLAVINFICGRPYSAFTIDLRTLIRYLRSAHEYYLNYIMPGIRAKLIQAISTGTPGDFTFLFVKHFDRYFEDLRAHLALEEKRVFPYVEQLLDGVSDPSFSIKDFEEAHQPIVGKLSELKELFIGHFTAEDGRVDMLNTVLFDIITLENDLTTHCRLEDSLFVPAVMKLESRTDENQPRNHATDTSQIKNNSIDEHGDVILTPREREIVSSIAHGLTNKDIADKLCLSIHTVTTHRRNISSKLNLHSSSSITLYAVMHGMISLDDVKI